MIEDKDDLLIKDFISEHPIVIENDAFSHRIIRNLRNDEARLGYIWTGFYLALVIIICWVTDALSMLIGTIKGLIADVMTNDIVIGHPIVIQIAILATSFLKIEFCLFIYFKEFFHTICMVIVTMR